MERPSSSTTNRKQSFLIGIFLLSSFLLSSFLFFIFPNLFGIWHYQIGDQLFLLRYTLKGKEKIYPPIVHVNLNDSDIQKYHFSVWDRGLYAKIITILTDAEVDSIVFDIVFPTLLGKGDDQLLIDATQQSGRVYYPVILIPEGHGATSEPNQVLSDTQSLLDKNLWYPKIRGGGTPRASSYAIPTFANLSNKAKGIGNITCYPEKDGVFRQFPLIMKYGDGYLPSLSFRVVCDYLNVSPEEIEINFGEQILLPGAQFPEGLTKDITIPIDLQGRMIINFVGPWVDCFSHYSFGKLVDIGDNDELIGLLRDEMEGDITIVSDTTTRGKDIGPSPFEKNYPLSGLHSNVINAILTQNFLCEISFGRNILIWLMLIVLLWLCATRLRPASFSFCSVILFLTFLIVSCCLFIYQNMITNLVCPSLGFLFSLITVNTYRYLTEEKEKAVMRSRFESYFAPPLLHKILKSPERLQASERKILTVLFSDIVDFTTWCATQTPERIRITLNEYFDEMTKIVFSYEGTIDKFMGDGLMVFFGDPLDQPDHALRAVKAATEMQKKSRELNRSWSTEDRLPIRIRIGINTGEVVVGNMGSEKRLDYTVIGSNVNLAQRLETIAPEDGILIAESVYNEVKDVVEAKFHGKITAKGIKEALSAYEVIVG